MTRVCFSGTPLLLLPLEGKVTRKFCPPSVVFVPPPKHWEHCLDTASERGKKEKKERKKERKRQERQAEEHLDLLLSRRKALGVIRSRLK